MHSIYQLFASVFIVAMVLLGGFAAQAGNSKYASLVIDADSGRVLHAANANDRRYPASLTKMMTIYLMFEALHQGRMDMDTRMTVSKKAAGMPQTNIGLRQGDTITVRDAVKALVVRSANDVATVAAEHLGKTEWGFGLKMTSKARDLGMNSTVFRNASGLPDSKQYSTARDLVVLATALKRHFPQYYHLFKTTSFTWKGRTYHSHNRVMQNLAGADGLKTGYIRASGFNLATSVQRNGRNLMAIVLGGKTAKSRDDHMVDLVERSYAKLDQEADVHQFAESTVPTPKYRPDSRGDVQMAAMQQQEIQGVLRNPAVDSPASRGQFQPVSYTQVKADKSWGVQVGAFQHSKEALMAAINATSLAKEELGDSRIIISNGVESTGNMIHRARLANLEEDQARKACQALIAQRESCFVFRVGSGQSL